MGTMKRKRRKKAARKWSAFQQQHQLSDEDMRLLRQTGYALAKLTEYLSDAVFANNTPISERIREVNMLWQEKVKARHAGIAAGLIEPKKKKKKGPEFAHDPAWAKAKKVCRLNMEDIRMAKELGMTPRSLMRNVRSPTQLWKTPVKTWIRDLYEKRKAKRADKQTRGESRASTQPGC